MNLTVQSVWFTWLLFLTGLMVVTGLHSARAESMHNPDRTVKSFSMEEALSRAVEQSQELRFSEREVELHANRFVRERREYFPTFSLSYASDTTVRPLSPDSRSRRLSVGVRQTVYDGGALARARRHREAEIGMKRREIERLRRETRQDAWDALVRYQLADERVQLRESSVTIAGRILSIAEEQFALGRITQRELNETRVSVAEQNDELQNERLSREQAHFIALKWLNLSPGTKLDIRDSFSAETSPRKIRLTTSDLHDSAVYRDQEIRRRQIALRYMKENAPTPARRFLPEISASVDVSLAAESLPLRDPGVSAGIDFSWRGDSPVSTGFSAGAGGHGEVRRGAQATTEPLNTLTADSGREQAFLELDRARDSLSHYKEDLSFRISRELSLFELSVDRWESARLRRDIAKEQALVLEAEAELGRAGPVDVLSAVNMRLDAELHLLEVAFESMQRRQSIAALTGLHPEDL